ncbi:MAG TPA: phosphatidylglycerophosphatase A [Calditrichaeota bacterium]|nr:phosphatidylglycerophosphatase A [Calditrichota bacterium]
MKLKQYTIYAIGTVLGSGFAPFAPGTAGSIVAVLLYYLLITSRLSLLVLTVVFFFIGVAVSFHLEKNEGKDAQIIVVDELVGQWIAFLFLPKTLPILITGFILFRLFDIFKPYPINALQKLKGGWGVMSDDVLAGIYANILIQIIIITGIIQWIR